MRVIAGAFGGRRLQAPRGRATRPTSDRVREALFSALGDLQGARVLDLYAGTGALGIEALSRGAARAVFVETARPALAALRANIDALALHEVSKVVALPVERAAADLAREGAFDLVLVDPPYSASGETPEIVTTLLRAGAIGDGARVVLEHASRDSPPDCTGLERVSTRTYGDTAITTYRVSDRTT